MPAPASVTFKWLIFNCFPAHLRQTLFSTLNRGSTYGVSTRRAHTRQNPWETRHHRTSLSGNCGVTSNATKSQAANNKSGKKIHFYLLLHFLSFRFCAVCVWLLLLRLLFTSFFSAFTTLSSLLLSRERPHKMTPVRQGACLRRCHRQNAREKSGETLSSVLQTVEQSFLSGWSHDQKHPISHLVTGLKKKKKQLCCFLLLLFYFNITIK